MTLRPLFLVATPAGAARVLLQALRGAQGVAVALGAFMDDVPGVRLVARDAAALGPVAESALRAALVDRDGAPVTDPSGLVAIAGGEGPTYNVAFLAAAFPQARFVWVAADPDALAPPGLDALAQTRRLRVDRAQLLADPSAELQRICAHAQIAYDPAMAATVTAASAPPAPVAPLALATYGPAPEAPPPAVSGERAFASVSTASFAEVLQQAGCSLLVSTYQTNRLACVRVADGGVNTHFRTFDKPMGIAVAPGRVALGTRTGVLDLRDMPDAARKLDPPGSHDACYLLRNQHVTGDIAVHDLAFAGGQLWMVATGFSCLATLDADHSFIPRWVPPFISRLAPEDRCHLNGLAVVDDRVAYVSALGSSDEPGGWREGKASGGVLIDVASGEPALAGLSMPHSPRWHDGRLWLLESGRGTLSVADLAAGTVETVAQLPGFTRGLAFAGDTAFVGLSQVRESATFGDLPITRADRRRECGVWMVQLTTGEITGFLRFEELVQEIFEVAVLPGVRFPEIAEPDGDTVALSYVLPGSGAAAPGK